jgi:tetratricopeptide (TPR) repeat protein
MHVRYSMLLIVAILLPPADQQASQSEIGIYSRQAEKGMAEKNWAEAAKALEKLARLAPDVAEIQGNLGLAYYSQNVIFKATQAFEHALKLNPKMTQAKLLLGLCYAELGRNEEAMKILAPAFRNPSDEPISRLIGLGLQRAYTALKQDAEATAVAHELVGRYPNDPEILFHASGVWADQSYQLMTRLIQAAPNSVWVHFANAQIHENLQHHDLAMMEYRTVLEIEPKLPGVHFRLGRLLLRHSRAPKTINTAKHEFEAELAIAPEHSDAEYELGEICREQRQFENALAHFIRAVRYHPQFEEAQIGLSRVLIHLGRTQEAVPHLSEAVRLNPQNKVPHFLLGSVYKSMGDKTGYRKEMAAFQKLREAESPERGLLESPATSSQATRQTMGLEMPAQAESRLEE